MKDLLNNTSFSSIDIYCEKWDSLGSSEKLRLTRTWLFEIENHPDIIELLSIKSLQVLGDMPFDEAMWKKISLQLWKKSQL